MSDMQMHPDFYPCTDGTHWKPLQDVAPDVIGEFMFMYATVGGVFAYKNSITREYVYLDDQGRGHLDGRIVPAARAVAAARDGIEYML